MRGGTRTTGTKCIFWKRTHKPLECNARDKRPMRAKVNNA